MYQQLRTQSTNKFGRLNYHHLQVVIHTKNVTIPVATFLHTPFLTPDTRPIHWHHQTQHASFIPHRKLTRAVHFCRTSSPWRHHLWPPFLVESWYLASHRLSRKSLPSLTLLRGSSTTPYAKPPTTVQLLANRKRMVDSIARLPSDSISKGTVTWQSFDTRTFRQTASSHSTSLGSRKGDQLVRYS